MLLKGIVLKCFTHIQNERTSAAVFHLLQGKRSIQTIHDAHLFNISQFYGIYRKLDKHIFNIIVTDLIKSEYLRQTKESVLEFQVTNKGSNWLMDNKQNMQLHYFNGLKYQTIDQVFFERLILLVQVLSNSKMKNTKYIPVIDKTAITDWVKESYAFCKENISQHLNALYTDLNNMLARFSNQQAHLFIDRLTGYNKYGLSKQQLSATYKLPEYDIQVLLVGMIHQILNHIYDNNVKYPFFEIIIQDLSISLSLTQSAGVTEKLLSQYNNIEKIAEVRGLTLNTIYDHIVEIALHDNHFKIDSYVNKIEERAIIQAIKESKSSRLREIKAYLNEDISYFQIRLVLATYHNVVKGDYGNES